MFLVRAATSSRRFGYAGESATDSKRIVTVRIVTAHRGYGEAEVDRQLTDLGVKNVAIPRTTRPTQARRAGEHRNAFRCTVKWRTGSEGRISYLRRYGWDRTRIDGIEGARIWTGHGVLARRIPDRLGI